MVDLSTSGGGAFDFQAELAVRQLYSALRRCNSTELRETAGGLDAPILEALTTVDALDIITATNAIASVLGPGQVADAQRQAAEDSPLLFAINTVWKDGTSAAQAHWFVLILTMEREDAALRCLRSPAPFQPVASFSQSTRVCKLGSKMGLAACHVNCPRLCRRVCLVEAYLFIPWSFSRRFLLRRLASRLRSPGAPVSMPTRTF